jgi:hypothetical protein
LFIAFYSCYWKKKTRRRLNTRGVEHHAQGRSHGLGRQVLPETSADHTRVSVSASDLAPDDADLLALSLPLLSTVDEGHPLAQVEVCVVARLNSLDAQQGHVGVLVPQTPVV